jgi:hypothetical protein
MKADVKWFEDRIHNLLIKLIESCINDNRKDDILELVLNSERFISTLGFQMEIDQVINYLVQSQSLIYQWILKEYPKIDNKDGMNEFIKIVDSMGFIIISAALGFFRGIESINIDDLSEDISEIKWENKEAIYTLNIAQHILSNLEDIQQKLSFEMISEKKRVTPDWYLRGKIFKLLAIRVRDRFDKINYLYSKLFLENIKLLMDNEHHILASELIDRASEFQNKLTFNLKLLYSTQEELYKSKLSEDDDWPTWDWDDIKEKIIVERENMAIERTHCLPGLLVVAKSSNMPDYFGGAVHLIGEELINALISNRTSTVSHLFPKYFFGIIDLFGILREKTKEWPSYNSAIGSYAPIIDLFEISGYFYVLSEFHQNPEIWSICTNKWDEYFSVRNKSEILKFFAFVISFGKNPWNIGPRGVFRNEWQQNIGRLINKLPRTWQRHRYEGRIVGIGGTEIVQHPSSIIRLMGGTHEMDVSFYDGTDIFIDMYLKKIPEAVDLDFGNHRSIDDALERWDNSGLMDDYSAEDEEGQNNDN